MPSGTPQVFTNITPEQYDRLAAKARASGIELTGNSGTASKLGVEVGWNYNPIAQSLTIQCLKTPFFMKATDVDSRIHKLVQDSLA
jgi:hypothetical protein